MNTRCSIIVATGASLFSIAGTAWAQDSAPARMVILDRNLQRISGSLERLAPKTIQYTDASGRSRSIDRARVLALYSERGHSASLPSALASAEGGGGLPGILRLTDGQVVPGFLVTPDNPGETISWRSRRIGQFSIPLERASSVLLADIPTDPTKPQRDAAILSNHDRVEGFVEAIGKQLVIEVDKQRNPIPIERVAWIGLANPAEPGSLPLVFLSDGSVLSTSELSSVVPAGKPTPQSTTATAQWALASESGTGVIDLDAIDAILFDPRAIVPLADIPVERTTGLQGRRWTPTPEISASDTVPIGLASISISGPAQVDWKLPSGSVKFGAEFALPPDAVAWGNALISVLASDASGAFSEVARADLSAERPAAEIVADVTGAQTLRIEVRGKAYSDVQARVTLRQPMMMRRP